jgi:hypothetical protein
VFKLLIYAVFLYVIYRLLTGGRKKKPVGHGSGKQEAGGGALTAHDELVEDPVCHIYIPKKQAIVLQDANTAVFFCSDQCRKMYIEAQTTTRQENG